MMDILDYQTLKWIHILSSTFLFGTGVGSAFYKFLADRRGNLDNIAYTNRHVVWADWLFTTPTVIIQPVSGVMLARVVGFPLDSDWLLVSMVLYAFMVACWLPVVVMQIRMERLSTAAMDRGTALAEDYTRLVRNWTILGVLAFIAMIAVYYLMVFKPTIWS
ncbi:MAG: DUF2269 domain-containing protein [Pseudohongiella sp.]|nr:DUF2269 domain-containing protein [Pseudohongiella sp.]